MERRTFLKLGIGSALLLGVVGGGVALMRPGLKSSRLTQAAREVMLAVSRAVLDGSLPPSAEAREGELQAQLVRVEDFVRGLPKPTQRELSQLLGLLGTAAGRVSLAGLHTPWGEASLEELQAALESMRHASLSLRQQAYHALRDITSGTYFSMPTSWAQMGYPGPTDL